MYNITIVSKCVGNIICEFLGVDEDIDDFSNLNREMDIDELVDKCNSLLPGGEEDLTEYSDISCVEQMTVHFEKDNNDKSINVVADVLTNQNPNENNILQDILNELEGQYSDGWGEGFEQREIDTWAQQEEVYDDESMEYYMEDVDFYLYISPWGTKDMTPENCRITVEEIPD